MRTALLIIVTLVLISRPAQALTFAIQGLPAFGVTSYDGADTNYGILLLTKSQLYFGQKSAVFQWGPILELDFKVLIPELVVGAGFRWGNRFYLSVDGGFYYSYLWGMGAALAPGLGFQITDSFYVVFPLMSKFTIGGVFFLEYLPHVGFRF